MGYFVPNLHKCTLFNRVQAFSLFFPNFLFLGKNDSGYISVNMTLGPSGSLVSESVFETLKHHSNGLNKKKPGTFWDYASSRTTFVIIQPKKSLFLLFCFFFRPENRPLVGVFLFNVKEKINLYSFQKSDHEFIKYYCNYEFFFEFSLLSPKRG